MTYMCIALPTFLRDFMLVHSLDPVRQAALVLLSKHHGEEHQGAGTFIQGHTNNN